MKTIVTAVVILATFSGMAQEHLSLSLPKFYKENKLKSPNIIKPDFQVPKYLEKQNNLNTIKPYFHKKSPFLFSLPDSTKDYVVVNLKQDGMPCIIPDMRKFNNMPNASRPGAQINPGNELGRMPNPYYRHQKPKG